MQTIILDEPGRLRLADTEPPGRAGAGEALVRVLRVGICGTDIHAYHGRQPFFSYPRILGHELGVEIVEVGEGPNPRGLKAGDRCAVEPYLSCGACVACRRGKTNCCVSLRTLGVHTDGGMREYIVVPLAKLHPARSLSGEQLALVETLAIGSHAVARAGLERGEWALVVGMGPIGLATTQFAHLAGARVIALDINAERLDFCGRLGQAEATVLAGAPEEVEARLRELTGDELPLTVFDATGSVPSMEQSFAYVAHGGRLVLVGLAQGRISFDDPHFHRREITLLATRNAVAEDFTRIIAAVEAGRIDTAPWITHRAPAAALPEVFAGWLAPGAGLLKGMALFD